MTRMPGMAPAQYEAWLLLFDLARQPVPWVLVGGQMTALLAAEGGVLPRITTDADVLVDVRAAPGSIAQVCKWLQAQGFDLDGITADGIGHKFVRAADPGPGIVEVDVLGPEGLGARTDTMTVPPARTVGVPASSTLVHAATTVQVASPRYENSVIAPGGFYHLTWPAQAAPRWT